MFHERKNFVREGGSHCREEGKKIPGKRPGGIYSSSKGGVSHNENNLLLMRKCKREKEGRSMQKPAFLTGGPGNGKGGAWEGSNENDRGGGSLPGRGKSASAGSPLGSWGRG